MGDKLGYFNPDAFAPNRDWYIKTKPAYDVLVEDMIWFGVDISNLWEDV